MESTPTPDEAAAALTEAHASAAHLAGELRLPSHFHSSIGVAIAIQIGTSAFGIVEQKGWAAAVSLFGGLALFLAVAAVQLVRFRRVNGVWVWALANRVVLGAGNTASVTYCAAFGIAVLTAFGGLWWLLPVPAAAGGVGYVIGGQRWLRDYRADPAGHTRGERTSLLAVVCILAATGLVLLVANR